MVGELADVKLIIVVFALFALFPAATWASNTYAEDQADGETGDRDHKDEVEVDGNHVFPP